MTGASDPREWIEKARHDARAARRLLLDPPELEGAAYHVHQAVEKAAKAILVDEGIRYPRGGGAGHDLDALAQLVPALHPLRARSQHLSDLTPWATSFRYPADDPFTVQPVPAKGEMKAGSMRPRPSLRPLRHRSRGPRRRLPEGKPSTL